MVPLKKLIFFMVGLAFTTVPVLANNITYDQTFRVGWATANITPDQPVLIAGQFHARLSDGVLDPVTATILAMESGNGTSSQKVIWISCDLVGISDGTKVPPILGIRSGIRSSGWNLPFPPVKSSSMQPIPPRYWQRRGNTGSLKRM